MPDSKALEERAYGLLTGILGDIADREPTGIEGIGEFLARTLEIAAELVLPLHGAPPLVTAEAVAARREINARLEDIIARGRADATITAAVTDGKYTLIDMHVPPGGGPPPHRGSRPTC